MSVFQTPDFAELSSVATTQPTLSEKVASTHQAITKAANDSYAPLAAESGDNEQSSRYR